MATNYARGVAFERRIKKEWEDMGYLCLRSAGSHGPFDLIAIPRAKNRRVTAIQCKRVATHSEAERLLAKFKANPPLPPESPVIQWMALISVLPRGATAFTVAPDSW
jgi:hypothetical protein